LEIYGAIAAVCVWILGWVVQVMGLSWEPVAAGLAIVAFAFTPRIMRIIKSKSDIQTFTGGDELLKQLEWIATRCEQLRNDMTTPTDDVRKATIRELYHLSIELETLRGKYYGIWTDGLKNKVTIVANQASEAGSALSGKDFEKAKAHADAAIQTARALTAYLKSPPTG